MISPVDFYVTLVIGRRKECLAQTLTFSLLRCRVGREQIFLYTKGTFPASVPVLIAVTKAAEGRQGLLWFTAGDGVVPVAREA